MTVVVVVTGAIGSGTPYSAVLGVYPAWLGSKTAARGPTGTASYSVPQPPASDLYVSGFAVPVDNIEQQARPRSDAAPSNTIGRTRRASCGLEPGRCSNGPGRAALGTPYRYV